MMILTHYYEDTEWEGFVPTGLQVITKVLEGWVSDLGTIWNAEYWTLKCIDSPGK